MPATVLIATAEYLPTLKSREDLADAITFSDGEALRALDVIIHQHPELVLLDREFAETSRGAALVNRIKADPALAGCEIRVIEKNSSYTQITPRRVSEPAAAAPVLDVDILAEAAIVVEEMTAPPASPLDQHGTRRAPRAQIVEGIEVEIDGNAAKLVDLSLVGAQVISKTILKPNQRVRVIFPASKPPLRVKGTVVWALFEIPKGQPHYRAGIEFLSADQAALTRFIERNQE